MSDEKQTLVGIIDELINSNGFWTFLGAVIVAGMGDLIVYLRSRRIAKPKINGTNAELIRIELLLDWCKHTIANIESRLKEIKRDSE